MKKIVILLSVVLFAFTFTSCRKKGDTIANIYIKDETNTNVSGAMVILYGTNTSNTPQQVAVLIQPIPTQLV